MPRKQDLRQLPFRLNVQTLVCLKKGSNLPFPSNSKTRLKVIYALLKALDQGQQKKLGPSIKLLLQYLAGVEKLPHDETFKEGLIDQAIAGIANGKAFPTAHMWDLVVAQQIRIVRYLEKYPYPKGNIQKRKEWILAHKDALKKEVISIPCLCGYSPDKWECDYEGRLETLWEEKPWIESKNPEEFTVAVLGALHTVSPHRIRDALKDHAKESKWKSTLEIHSEKLGNGKTRITTIPRRAPLKK